MGIVNKIRGALGGGEDGDPFVCTACGAGYETEREFCPSCGSGAVERK